MDGALRIRHSLFYLHCLPLLFVLLTTGCAHKPPALPLDPSGTSVPHVELADTPFVSQQRYQCGPAALAMTLQQSGVDVAADDLVPQVWLPERKGSLQIEMLAASRRYSRVPYLIAPTLAALMQALESGYPVLVLQNLGLEAHPVWHYAVVIGYARDSDSVILRSGTDKRQRLPAWLFLRTWRLAGNWGLVTLRPEQIPAFAERRSYLAAVAAMETVADPGAVLDAYRSALRRWPRDATALFGVASMLQEQHRYDEAKRAYQDLLSIHPDHIAALNNLAQVYADLGCYRKADETIRAALALSDETHPLYPVLRDTYAGIRQQNPGGAADRCSTGD